MHISSYDLRNFDTSVRTVKVFMYIQVYALHKQFILAYLGKVKIYHFRI